MKGTVSSRSLHRLRRRLKSEKLVFLLSRTQETKTSPWVSVKGFKFYDLAAGQMLLQYTDMPIMSPAAK